MLAQSSTDGLVPKRGFCPLTELSTERFSQPGTSGNRPLLNNWGFPEQHSTWLWLKYGHRGEHGVGKEPHRTAALRQAGGSADRHLHSIQGGGKSREFQKRWVFELSIFIIKIITSLVKVQMLQHGVKTPLE